METKNLSKQLIIANKELIIQSHEKAQLATKLGDAIIELEIQNKEKGKREAELIIANIELDFQNGEKLKRARELIIANKELDFQNEEKRKRAVELIIANKELVFQNKEKEKLAAELIIANMELNFQNKEKEKRAAELIIANIELNFQNKEKEKRAAELIIANIELNFQNGEKKKRAAELIIANIELNFQNGEKKKRAAESIVVNRELLVQKQEKNLHEAEAKNGEFFNMISREFKTPFTNIKAINQFLEKTTNQTDKTYPFILKAGHSIKRLENLIEDLLDIIRISSGRLYLNVAEFNFSDTLINSISKVQKITNKHEIILKSSIDRCYKGDRFRIEQVMINLLNNAIKYSSGTNKILVKAKVKSGQIVVIVEGFGLEVANEDTDQLFQRFYHVRKSAMFYQGFELGLYIASEIIKKHNGRFIIESEPGNGSRFSFSLPLIN